MKKHVLIAHLGAVLFVVSATGSASASSITFDFNGLAANANNARGPERS